jgi:hypothetical protein
MAGLTEKGICNKCFFNLEKPASETYEVLQKAIYGGAMSITQPLNGIYVLELAVHRLRIWNVQIILVKIE